MKQAQVFDVSMIFVVIAAMVMILYVANTSATELSPWKSMGHRAFELQNTYAEGDYFVNFLSTSARWSAAEAVLELGEKGGDLKQSCGASDGFVFWNKQNDYRTFCIPNVYEQFYVLMGQKLDLAIALYTQSKSRKVSLGGQIVSLESKPFKAPYEFLVSDKKLIAVATAPIIISSMTPPEEFIVYNPLDLFGLYTKYFYYPPYATGVYAFRPNFEISFNYNFEVYRALGLAAKKAVGECSYLETSEEKTGCLEARIQEALFSAREPAKITIQNSQDIYYIKITQEAFESIYFDKTPVIKFALFIPTLV